MGLNLACEHLYPGAIDSGQIKLQDDSDGNGPYIAYFDPALGTQPTQSELDAAEIAYQPPSILEGGDREPTTAELDANKALGVLYYMTKVQDHVNQVAASFNFGNASINPRTKALEFSGDINNIAKYLNRQTGQNGQLARTLETWNDDVWLTLRSIQADWLADVITAPTWPELLAQLPAAPTP